MRGKKFNKVMVKADKNFFKTASPVIGCCSELLNIKLTGL